MTLKQLRYITVVAETGNITDDRVRIDCAVSQHRDQHQVGQDRRDRNTELGNAFRKTTKENHSGQIPRPFSCVETERSFFHYKMRQQDQ